MKNSKSHLKFDANQRSGILLLCILIAGLLVSFNFYKPKPTPIIDVSSPEILQLQVALDSLRAIAIEAKKPKIYPFNPNFITDYKAYTLGMSPAAFDRLKNFRSKNKWIHSISDFKKVTKVSDSVLDKISPFFKFPDWVTNPKPRKKYTSSKISEVKIKKTFDQKIDLNKATAIELQKVYGIGPALSARIVKRRKSLGGFSDDKQLLGVWGLSEKVIKGVLEDFTVKTPKKINKMNVNTASASDIATVPGISFDLAKSIWEFRVLRDGINKLEELQKIEGMSSSKYSLIDLYLYAN